MNLSQLHLHALPQASTQASKQAFIQAQLKSQRKIIHIDMDAFYASVEIKDHPELQGKAVIVGGNPQSRSVVCAASYEARKYGVRSAMSTANAQKICPLGIFLPPRLERYKQVSAQIHKIFQKYTSLIEPLSLDEAWLDVSHHPSATKVAQEILLAIWEELRLTASAGVSYNKMLAKIATEVNKPNGMFVLPPANAFDFIKGLSLRKLPGVGKVTLEKLQKAGFSKCEDLLGCSRDFLQQRFGKFGLQLYEAVRGVDERPVQSSRERKSIGAEWTFQKDLAYGPELLQSLENLLQKLESRLEQKGLLNKARCIQLKVKYQDFKQCTRSISKPLHPSGVQANFAWEQAELYPLIASKLEVLLKKETRLVRLIGVSASNFIGEASPRSGPENSSENDQLDIFEYLALAL